MKLVTIENTANTIKFDFNDFSADFDASKLTVVKTGCRIYLAPDKSCIHVLFPDHDKIEIESGTYVAFENPNTQQSFESMEQLFDLLSDYLSI